VKTVNVRGIEDLAQALRDHGVDVATGMETVAIAGAEVLRGAMSTRAPVRSGKLRGNIGIWKSTVDETKASVPVGPGRDAFYGLFLELGTVHQAAQPFMRPAVDESQDRVLAAAKTAARKLIDG